MRSKCINSTSGRKFVTGNELSDIDFLHDMEILAARRCFLFILTIFHCACAVLTILLLPVKVYSVIFEFSAPVFTRTWLRYVRLFDVAIPSVVCLSVTLVHPTQWVEPFGKISSPLCTLAILWPPCKILRRSSQGTPPPGALNARGVSKYSDFRPIEGYIP